MELPKIHCAVFYSVHPIVLTPQLSLYEEKLCLSERALHLAWRSLPPCLKLLYELKKIIDNGGFCWIAPVITPLWMVVGHEEAHELFHEL